MAELRKIDLGERSSEGFVGQVSPTMTLYFHNSNLQNLEFSRFQKEPYQGEHNQLEPNEGNKEEPLVVLC